MGGTVGVVTTSIDPTLFYEDAETMQFVVTIKTTPTTLPFSTSTEGYEAPQRTQCGLIRSAIRDASVENDIALYMSGKVQWR